MKKILLFLSCLFACLIPRWYLLRLTGFYFFHMRVSLYCLSLFGLAIFLALNNRFLSVSKNAVQDISVFFFWVIVAIVLSLKTEDMGNTINSIYYLNLGLLSVLIFNCIIQDVDCVKVSFCAVFCAVLIHLAIGYYEVFSHSHFFLTGINDSLITGKPVSIFYNNNDYGTFIIVMLPLAAAFIKMSVNGLKSNILSIALAGTCFYIVLYAQSDTILIATVLVIVAFLARIISRSCNLALRILIIVLVVVASVVTVMRTADSIVYLLASVLSKEQCRLNLLKNGFYFLKESRGLGIGYGNMEIYLQYKSIYYVFNTYYFHNWYFEILFCGGIVMFVVYLRFHIGKIKQLFSLSKIDSKRMPTDLFPRQYNPSMLVLSSFLIFSAVCISSSTNLYSEWMWMYFGLISAYVNLLNKNAIKA